LDGAEVFLIRLADAAPLGQILIPLALDGAGLVARFTRPNTSLQMARESNKPVVVGVLVGGDHRLNKGALPFPFRVRSFAKAINIVAKFGLTVKSLKVGRVRLRMNGSGQSFDRQAH